MSNKMAANVVYALEVVRFITVNMFQYLEIEVIQQPLTAANHLGS